MFNAANILHIIHEMCYMAIVGVGVYGIYCAILLFRQIKRRGFRTEAEAQDFVGQVNEHFQNGDYEEAEALCTSPQYWYNAIAVLSQVAINKRHLSVNKIRQLIAARFTRDVLTNMEALVAGIQIVVKVAP